MVRWSRRFVVNSWSRRYPQMCTCHLHLIEASRSQSMKANPPLARCPGSSTEEHRRDPEQEGDKGVVGGGGAEGEGPRGSLLQAAVRSEGAAQGGGGGEAQGGDCFESSPRHTPRWGTHLLFFIFPTTLPHLVDVPPLLCAAKPPPILTNGLIPMA